MLCIRRDSFYWRVLCWWRINCLSAIWLTLSFHCCLMVFVFSPRRLSGSTNWLSTMWCPSLPWYFGSHHFVWWWSRLCLWYSVWWLLAILPVLTWALPDMLLGDEWSLMVLLAFCWLTYIIQCVSLQCSVRVSSVSCPCGLICPSVCISVSGNPVIYTGIRRAVGIGMTAVHSTDADVILDRRFISVFVIRCHFVAIVLPFTFSIFIAFPFCCSSVLHSLRVDLTLIRHIVLFYCCWLILAFICPTVRAIVTIFWHSVARYIRHSFAWWKWW